MRDGPAAGLALVDAIAGARRRSTAITSRTPRGRICAGARVAPTRRVASYAPGARARASGAGAAFPRQAASEPSNRPRPHRPRQPRHNVARRMLVFLYLVSLILALPAVAFAGLVLVIDHVIEVRNPIKLFLDFLLAFGWGSPNRAAGARSPGRDGVLQGARLPGASAILLCNLAALAVILRSDAAPKDVSETFFLMPALLSMMLSGYVVWTHAQPKAALTTRPMPVEKRLQLARGGDVICTRQTRAADARVCARVCARHSLSAEQALPRGEAGPRALTPPD